MTRAAASGAPPAPASPAPPAVTGPNALRPREREVIEAWILLGANKLVAHELGISEQTVKNYVTSILGKLDCIAMGQAAVRYDRWMRSTSHSVTREDRRSGLERRRSYDRRRHE